MKKIILVVLSMLFIFMATGCNSTVPLEEYTIFLHPDAESWERDAAYDFQSALKEAHGVTLDIVLSQDKRTEHEILIGKATLPEEMCKLFDYASMGYNGYGIVTYEGKYVISAPTEVGLTLAIKHFNENVITEKGLPEKYSYTEQSSEGVAADGSKRINVSIDKDTGLDVYKVHKDVPSGYRYGPSMIVNDDGSIDMWLAGGGSGLEQWDWITYMHSKDGVEWSEEKCVLQPTPNALDHYSCCDPGVIYLNGYYYLGYTSTLNENQCDNNLYVARSENPDGPFEKWNGKGWGGNDPKPIVFFAEDQALWGTGEVSFVELDGTLYIYYTMNGSDGHITCVSTADATDENWPLTMKYKGVALGSGTNDAIDVKYVDEFGKFIAVASEERLSENSYLMFYESIDGFSFFPVDAVKKNIYYFCHNPGISGSSNGHITPGMKTYVAYAYGKGWGIWNTRLQEIEITQEDTTDFEEINGINLRKPIQRDERDKNLLKMVGITTGNTCVMRFPHTQKRIMPTLVYCDVTHSNWKNLNAYKSEIKVYGYDENVIKLADAGVISFDVVGIGETTATIEYKGHITYLYVIIYDQKHAKDIVSVEPMAYDTINFETLGNFQPQIKSIVTYGDGSWEYAWSQSEHGISYEYDSTALEINDNSYIFPKKPGTHKVTIKAGDKSSVLTVNVISPDLTKLEFANDPKLGVLRQINNAETSIVDGKLKCVTTKAEDPFITVDYTDAFYKAEDFDSFTLRYMIPKKNSIKSYQAQIFFRCNEAILTEEITVRTELVKDGAYHDLRIDLSDKDFWTGDITEIRIDFFDTCGLKDEFYIESIELK